MLKVGDKIRCLGNPDQERLVLAVFRHPARDDEWVTVFVDGIVCSAPSCLYELVPDPMVARREAYIEWAKIAWSGGEDYYREHFDLVREGKQDETVNCYYDAFVATKHLFV